MKTVSLSLLKLMRPARMSSFRELVDIQWNSPDKLAASSEPKVTAILRHACRQVPFYRDFCTREGLDPTALTFADLQRFPLQTKRELMDRVERFLDPATPPSDLIPNFTGGSSGAPFQFFNDRRILEIHKANDMRGRTWTGWSPGEKQAILWAHPRDNKASRSLRGRFLENVVHRMRTLNAYNMDAARIDEFYLELKSYQPIMMLGFASSLAFFAEYLQHQGKKTIPLKGILSSAETLTPEHRAAIEGFFECKVFDRYGSREFGVIAQQCEKLGGLHVFSDQVHLEILRPDGTPCNPGERGEIVITDLTNRAMPFIRYRTGDMATWLREPCSCGRGFPLLEGVSGRTSELLVGKNGKFYSCLGPRFFGPDIPGIAQMQVIQESREKVIIKVVPGEDWSAESGKMISRKLISLLGDIAVEIREVPEIPPSASGKYRFTISNVSPFP